MDDCYKANGARLHGLLINKGTEAIRKVFDSIHPPATLTATLCSNPIYTKLQKLQKQRIINPPQMAILFPPISLAPSTSKDYDITLFFILLRNICGLLPPATTRSWNTLPPPTDLSREADLVRIKNYRNCTFAHITTTAVDNGDFEFYWDDISAVLIRQGLNAKEIKDLKTRPLHEESKTVVYVAVALLVLILLLCIVLIFYNYPKEDQASFALDFSSHLNNSNSNFVGRKWFFQELEHAVNNSREQSGVIIVGDPGSGKSAIMSQLISSPSSSPFIHGNIIGYYVCKFDESRTRDGMRFVHTLVEQLSKNIPEYSSAIKNRTIQNELNIHCKDDPIGCFHTTILDPIKELKRQQNTNTFILIDALDECMEKDGENLEIITILKNKMTKFPDWIKLIISSRNKTSLIAQLPTFEKLAINSTDQRNLEDIRSYIENVMLGNDRFETEPEKKYVKGLIKQLYEINEGNFLYFKTLLQYLNKNKVSNLGRDFFPPTLDQLYGFIFRDRFERRDFERFAPIFEVLLAAESPPTMTELEEIFKIREDTYNTQRVVKQVSEYLIIGSDETVRFYHQSFANWLMNQTDDSDGLFIQIFRGHQYIVDYKFDYFHKRDTTPTLRELSKLSMHVLFGKMEKRQVSQLQGLNVNEIWDPDNGECILHALANERESTPIIKIFLNNFDSIDIFTKFRNLTPLCYAASSGNIDNLKLFIENGADVNNVFNYYYNTISTIARRGFTEIAELLITNGIDFDKKYQFRDKPLREAAMSGQLDFVQFLINKGVNVDVGELYHAARKNHSDIVKILLDSGIRDVCLACEQGVPYSCPTYKVDNPYHPTNSCFCETALYTAVSWGHLNVVKLLLSYGKASLECKDHLGRTPLLRAAEWNDTKMATLLLDEGANVEAECGTLINIYEYQKRKHFYTKNCNKDVCPCGTKSIHLFTKQSSWEMVKELVFRWNANPFSENCQGLTPVSINKMENCIDIIRNFNDKSAGEIVTNKTALRCTVICGSLKTIKKLTSIANSSFFETVYEDGMTLLHLAANWSAYPVTRDDFSWKIQSCTENIYDGDWYTDKTNFFLQSVKEYKKRLKTVKLLSKLQQNINKADKYGRTALHYAAAREFAGAVRHLVSQGSDWKIKDQNGDTPLELALKESPLHPRYFLPCRMTSDGVFQSCNSTIFDVTVNDLIMLQKSTFKKCNTDTKRLLRTLVKKNMPLSLYSLFKIGVDVNCGVALKMQLNISKLKNDEISEVFKIFEVDLNVKCDVPFNQSELHLMAYLGRPNNIGNFFKPSVNNQSFPLERFINSHPKGFRILDECRDKEGYLAIHRAAQGGNVDAVSWFISLGVNISKRTRSGWYAHDLSLYKLAEYSILNREFDYVEFEVLGKRTLEKLLVQFLKTLKFTEPESTENSRSHSIISLLMKSLNRVLTIDQEFTEISFTNIQHAIGSFYLFQLYRSVATLQMGDILVADLDILVTHYPEQTSIIDTHYPEREAEYHLIYNFFFQTPEVDLSSELDLEDLFKCPGMNDLLPKREEIKGQIQRCNNHCWESTSQVIGNLSAFPDIVIENASFDTFGKRFIHTVLQMAISELRYRIVKMFYKIPSRFWRQVSEAYSCSYRCRCEEIMGLVQKEFTSKSKRHKRVGKFVAGRMGWNDTSTNGDVLDRWPFRFLLKKALKKDKDYEDLKIFVEHFEHYIHKFFEDISKNVYEVFEDDRITLL